MDDSAATVSATGARNIAIRHAKMDVAVIVDGHCTVPDRRYLANLSEDLGKPEALAQIGTMTATITKVMGDLADEVNADKYATIEDVMKAMVAKTMEGLQKGPAKGEEDGGQGGGPGGKGGGGGGGGGG